MKRRARTHRNGRTPTAGTRRDMAELERPSQMNGERLINSESANNLFNGFLGRAKNMRKTTNGNGEPPLRFVWRHRCAQGTNERRTKLTARIKGQIKCHCAFVAFKGEPRFAERVHKRRPDN